MRTQVGDERVQIVRQCLIIQQRGDQPLALRGAVQNLAGVGNRIL